MKNSLKSFAVANTFILLFTFSFCSTGQEAKPVLIEIESVRGSLETGEMIIILAEADGDRVLPISVGGDQALAIHLGHKRIKAPRPMTHDLMASVLETLETQVERVVITELKEGTYYAEIILDQGEETYRIDARPSDAIALSLRVNAPIYTMPDLLERLPQPRATQSIPAHLKISKLGLEVQTLSLKLARIFGRDQGVLISAVHADSPAQKNGLQAGDILTKVAEREIKDLDDFENALALQEPASSFQIEFFRDGKIRQASLTIQK